MAERARQGEVRFAASMSRRSAALAFSLVALIVSESCSRFAGGMATTAIPSAKPVTCRAPDHASAGPRRPGGGGPTRPSPPRPRCSLAASETRRGGASRRAAWCCARMHARVSRDRDGERRRRHVPVRGSGRRRVLRARRALRATRPAESPGPFSGEREWPRTNLSRSGRHRAPGSRGRTWSCAWVRPRRLPARRRATSSSTSRSVPPPTRTRAARRSGRRAAAGRVTGPARPLRGGPRRRRARASRPARPPCSCWRWEAGRELRGRVVDPSRRTVAGATVRVLANRTGWAARPPRRRPTSAGVRAHRPARFAGRARRVARRLCEQRGRPRRARRPVRGDPAARAGLAGGFVATRRGDRVAGVADRLARGRRGTAGHPHRRRGGEFAYTKLPPGNYVVVARAEADAGRTEVTLAPVRRPATSRCC